MISVLDRILTKNRSLHSFVCCVVKVATSLGPTATSGGNTGLGFPSAQGEKSRTAGGDSASYVVYDDFLDDFNDFGDDDDSAGGASDGGAADDDADGSGGGVEPFLEASALGLDSHSLDRIEQVRRDNRHCRMVRVISLDRIEQSTHGPDAARRHISLQVRVGLVANPTIDVLMRMHVAGSGGLLDARFDARAAQLVYTTKRAYAAAAWALSFFSATMLAPQIDTIPLRALPGLCPARPVTNRSIHPLHESIRSILSMSPGPSPPRAARPLRRVLRASPRRARALVRWRPRANGCARSPGKTPNSMVSDARRVVSLCRCATSTSPGRASTSRCVEMAWQISSWSPNH